ncbi:MAG: ATPase [Alistipes sp.]|jgi:V/A-type H+-transporting ATPase subunit K|nr:ATPase [Alistipes sp.]
MTAILLAYIGVFFMVGFSGMASAIGTAICGITAVGSMKKDSSKFGSYMILSALPGSQGLYGFVAYFMISGFLVPEITIAQGVAIFAGGLVMALVATISAYMQSRVCANGIAAMGNGHDVMTNTLILAAFPELYAILGLASVFLISIAI